MRDKRANGNEENSDEDSVAINSHIGPLDLREVKIPNPQVGG